MSWDDDDFEVGGPPKVASTGYPGGSPARGPKSKAKAKPKAKPVVDQPLDDPEAERLRQRKLQEDADAAAIRDTFGEDVASDKDVEDELFQDDEEEEDVDIQWDITDTFDDVLIAKTSDMENFAKAVFKKLEGSKQPRPEHKFLFELLKDQTTALKIADCEALQKTLTTLLKEKKKVIASKAQAAGKSNDITKKHAKIDVYSEVNMIYGDGDDEDWEEEEEKT